ncbi:hypothetical protein [Mycoplasma crocodyli]|uniref:Uncharacterized protein n=1 Tax=Mycoplasma crocodyli (strain ATCC 51981 / MP145) TaxID=512564 RepID=D5E5J4_MYCCM|nr:hypothetical protein [Mycoplasma crocodyli]ADE19961.1 conserved hypothetical protein [Mycoplasma crocodyli MP145]
MDITLKAFIKKTNNLQEELDDLIVQEKELFFIEYLEGQKVPANNYSFVEYTKKVKKLIKVIQDNKKIIADYNAKTITKYNNLNINECLFYLAQLNSYLNVRLNDMKVYKQENKTFLDDGNVKITKYLFNSEELKKEITSTREEINAIQEAIDYANLTTTVK